MRWTQWVFLVAVALAVIALDQISKALVVASLDLYEQWAPVEALRPYFTFTYVRNTGAAFGILQDGNMLLALVAFVVVGMILYFYRQMPHQSRAIRLALGLQLGGASGNLIDRLRQGYVVDFFDFKIWPVFNVADSSIVVGVCLLLLAMWWEERRAGKPQPPAPPVEDKPSSATPR